MKVNLSKAVKQFFPNPSLEMVYFEAVANAVDAGADLIEIKISLKSYNEPESLRITISDNGEGFTDENFRKFSSLFETDEDHHKGLGRLVFLHYFKRVGIQSIYNEKVRNFDFTLKYDESQVPLPDGSPGKTNGTQIELSGHQKKIHKYNFIRPDSIKESIILHFFPQFHQFKQEGKPLKIKILLNVEVENEERELVDGSRAEIDMLSIPELNKETIQIDFTDLYSDFELHYSIDRTEGEQTVIMAFCAEGRTIPMSDMIPMGQIPKGYRVFFLLYSDFFNGKVNSSRQKLELESHTRASIRKTLIKRIGKILYTEIPSIKDTNQRTQSHLNKRYPHLSGYFEPEMIGILDRGAALKNAQERFFKDQREVLEAEELTNEQYEKSLRLSSRLLTEYVLYRQKILAKLSDSLKEGSESDIHNLIVPMRDSFVGSEKMEDIYRNNAWLLDDKFMSYRVIFSDQKMKELIEEISFEQEISQQDRPDIAMVFSRDPDNSEHFDVVIVELKKKNAGANQSELVISQLRDRARKLAQYFAGKLQRIWFYGIVDIDNKMEIRLRDQQFTRLFSADKVFFKSQSLELSLADPSETFLADIFILSYDSLIQDAKDRNATFLDILKEGIRNSTVQK